MSNEYANILNKNFLLGKYFINKINKITIALLKYYDRSYSYELIDINGNIFNAISLKKMGYKNKVFLWSMSRNLKEELKFLKDKEFFKLITLYKLHRYMLFFI